MRGRKTEHLLKEATDPFPGQDYGVVRVPRKARKVVQEVEESLDKMVEQSEKAAGEATLKLSETVNTLKEESSKILHSVQSSAKKSPTSAKQLFDRNPIAIGIIAFLIGALIAVAAPQTETENVVFGTARQRLIERTSAAANDLRNKAKAGAKEVAQTIHEQMVEQFEDEG